MPTDDKHAYYEARRRYSIAQAEAASDPAVAKTHREFAEAYSDMIRASEVPAVQGSTAVSARTA